MRANITFGGLYLKTAGKHAKNKNNKIYHITML